MILSLLEAAMHDAMSRNKIFGDAGFDRHTMDGKSILSLKIADILRKRRCETDRINDCRGAQFLDSAHAINAGQQHKRKRSRRLQDQAMIRLYLVVLRHGSGYYPNCLSGQE